MFCLSSLSQAFPGRTLTEKGEKQTELEGTENLFYLPKTSDLIKVVKWAG
jgi:hypothetical protein